MTVTVDWTDLGPLSNNGQSIVAESGNGTLLVVGGTGTAISTSSNQGTSWTATASGVKNWKGIAVDDDGNVVVASWIGASVGLTGVARSVDRGVTWNLIAIAGAQALGPIAVSGDGQYVLVADAYDNGATPVINKLYLSSDGGLTFAQTGPATPSAAHSLWQIAAMARDGSAFVAGYNTGAAGHNLVKSTDHGATWGSIDPTGAVTPFDWGGVVVADGGQKIVITYGDTGAAGHSSDGGTTWSLNAAPDWFEALAGDAQADLLVACGDGSTTQSVYMSFDLGVTWTAQDPPGALVFDVPGGLTSTSDGSRLYASRHNGNVWIGEVPVPPSPPVAAFGGGAGSSAALLPNGMQTFLDQNGDPLANGQVWFWVPGTTTGKPVWQDGGKTLLLPQPVILDGAGRAVIYGSGQYMQRVEDVDGAFQWEQLTQSPGTNTPLWGGLSTGSGNAQVVNVPEFASIDGQQIMFEAGGGNSGPFVGPATLQPNPTTGPIQIVKDTIGGPIPLTGSELVTYNVYVVTYTTHGAWFHLTPRWGP